MFQRDLIYDLGMFDGEDTRFYLAKGFRVLALEANPAFCETARHAFAGDIARGALTIVNRALADSDEATVPFYLNGAQSSLFREAADRSGACEEIRVRTTTLTSLLARFGVPYYLKCDIEGADALAVDQLRGETDLPPFASFEGDAVPVIAKLASAGYDRFQFVNQGYHELTREPSPAREGVFTGTRFTGRSSGLFGRDLAPPMWFDRDGAERQARLRAYLLGSASNRLVRYAARKFGKWTGRRWLIAQGWVDVHAARSEFLMQGPP